MKLETGVFFVVMLIAACIGASIVHAIKRSHDALIELAVETARFDSELRAEVNKLTEITDDNDEAKDDREPEDDFEEGGEGGG